MKKLLFILVFIFQALNSQAKVVEKVVAVVDGEMLLLTEIDDFKKRLKSKSLIDQNLISLSPYDTNTSAGTIEYLIAKKLIILDALKGLPNSSLEKIAKQEVQKLADQNKISLKTLKKEMKKRSIDFSDYKKFIAESYLVKSALEKNIVSQVRPTQEDFVSYLKSQNVKGIQNTFVFNLDQIFISKENSKILDKINRDNFYDYFNKSEEVDSLNLGTLKLNELSKQHQEKIKNLSPGELSQAIEEETGFRLFFVKDKASTFNVPNTNKVKTLQQSFYNKLLAHRFKEWMSQLKENSFIRYNS